MASLKPAWELPFVSVFKICGVAGWTEASKSGDVSSVLDRDIGKKVLELKGSISSRNYVQLPGSTGKTLGLTGRFCYVQIRPEANKKWAFHLDILTADKYLHRVSIGNMYKKKSAGARGIQIQMDLVPNRWVTVAIDFATILQPSALHAFEVFKGAHFCATMRVRNLFTTDYKYTSTSMPKDVAMVPVSRSHEVDFVWVPEEPVDVEAKPDSPQRAPLLPGSLFKKPTKAAESRPSQAIATIQEPFAPMPEEDEDTHLLQQILPDPCLELERVNGYTGEFTRSLLWSPSTEEIVLACNSLAVVMSADGSRQRYLMGHTSSVCAMAFSGDGRLLATGQEGKHALIRIWDFASGNCLAIVCGHPGGGLVTLDISPDGKALAAVGMDAQARQSIALWDISKIGHVSGRAAPYEAGKCPPLVLRQSTEYNIRALKFSPYEHDRLMTCGKDSIRTYRLKGGTLRGISIRLVNDPEHCGARPLPPGTSSVALAHNLFTDMAYETSYGLQAMDEKHVFVATAAGAVFQVNYGTRQLECVYQLHAAPINSIQINEGFCVTASDDKYVRVWPVDFSDFFLEAEHETPVSSIGLSTDGLRIAVGTEGGSVGVMDVPTHQYLTLLRSHTGAVTGLDVDVGRGQFVTTSEDGSIRVWDLDSYEQLFEFNAADEKVACVALHPKRHEIAAGFSSGVVRVFDISSTTLIQEHQQHRSSVTALVISVEGDRMYSASDDGSICVYDILQNYLPVKYLATSRPGVQVHLASSPDGRLVASTCYDAGAQTAALLLFHAGSLEPYMRIETTAQAVTDLQFNPQATQLIITTKERKLERYSIVDGSIVAGINGIHRVACHTFHCDPTSAMVATGGADGLVKVWPYTNYDIKDLEATLGQTFSGHSDSISVVRFAGDRLITVDGSDCICLWKVKPGKSEERAKQLGGALGDKSNAGNKAQPSSQTTSTNRRMAWLLPDRAGASSIDSMADQEENLDPEIIAKSPDRERSPPGRAGGSQIAAQSQHVPEYIKGHPGASILPPRVMSETIVGFSGMKARSNTLWSPETGFFAYSSDNVVVVEDLLTRKQRYLAAHTKAIGTMALNSTASILATVASGPELSGTADICLWNTEHGACTSVLSYHPTAAHSLAFTEDSSYLLSVGRHPECSVVVWDVATAKIAAVGRTSEAAAAACWRPGSPADMPEFVTIGSDSVLRWTLEPTHLAQRTLALTEEMQQAGLTSVACVSSWCYVGDDKGNVWKVELDAVAEPPVKCFTVPQLSRGVCCAVSHIATTKSRMVVGTSDGQVVTYAQDEEGEWKSGYHLEVDGGVQSMVMEKDLREGIVGTNGCTVWYFTIAPQITRVPLVYGHSHKVLSISASGDNASLLASTSSDGLLRIWRVGTNDSYVLMEFESPQACTRAVFLSDSKVCVASYTDGTLRAFDLDKVCVRWTVVRHHSPVVGLEANDNGTQVLSAGQDASLAVTDVESGGLMVHATDLVDRSGGMTMSGVHGALHDIHDLSVSSRDRRMCSLIWPNRMAIFPSPWKQSTCTVVAEWRSGDFQRVPAEGHRASCSFSPKDSHIVIFTSPSAQGRIMLFDYRDSTVVRCFDMPQPIITLRPSPNGSLVAAGGLSNSVFLVDYSSGAWSELAGHSSSVQDVTFTSNSRRLMSAGGNVVMSWRIAEPLA